MSNIRQYISENLDNKFLPELFSLISIPSISTISGYDKEIRRCAERYAELLKEAGVDKTEIYETAGNPIVYAEKIVDENLPTALIYAHYDVVDVVGQQWATDPFQPEIIDGKIYARGADDDKGQGFMHVKAFEYVVKHGKLPFNVKFVIEGEEECGSVNFTKFCKVNKDLLKADFAMVSDTKMINSKTPSIMTGLRGVASWNITLSERKNEVQSGHYGGAIVNPINELCRIIAKLKDDRNKINIDYFYEDVIKYSDEERVELQKTPLDKEALAELGIVRFEGEEGFEPIEHIGIRPCLDVIEIRGGSGGNKIPQIATAKLSCRLVPHQDVIKIGQLVCDYLHSVVSNNINLEVVFNGGENPYHSKMSEVPYADVMFKAFETVYGMKPYDQKNGGSIGAITILKHELGLKSLIIGFGLSEDAIHGANESYPLEQFTNGIETIIEFYKNFGITQVK